MLAALATTFLGLSGGTASAWPGSGDIADWTRMPHTRSTAPGFVHSSVWVYGDSITNQTWQGLAANLKAQGMSTAVDAWSGRPTAPAVDQLIRDLARFPAPKMVVMATGSNDVFHPMVMSSQIDRVKDAVAEHPGTRLVWVNVRVGRTNVSAIQHRADMRNSTLVNLQIRSAIPKADIVDWANFLASKPSRPAAYLRDGVHTTVSGAGARNALIEQALDRR